MSHLHFSMNLSQSVASCRLILILRLALAPQAPGTRHRYLCKDEKRCFEALSDLQSQRGVTRHLAGGQQEETAFGRVSNMPHAGGHTPDHAPGRGDPHTGLLGGEAQTPFPRQRV